MPIHLILGQTLIIQLVKAALICIEAVELRELVRLNFELADGSDTDVSWMNMTLLWQCIGDIGLWRNVVSCDLILSNLQFKELAFLKLLVNQWQFFLYRDFTVASQSQQCESDQVHLKLQNINLNKALLNQDSFSKRIFQALNQILHSWMLVCQTVLCQFYIIQKAMRAVHIQRYGRLPILTQCPIPERQKDQLLIKMKYVPINPSDLFFYLGLYGIKKQGFPIMGFEGSGVIRQAQNKSLIGKKVSVFANMTNGTYAEYIVSNNNEVLVWPDETKMSLQEMSMCSVNPLSVLGMADIIHQSQAQTVVLSAAASNTSKMLMRLLKKHASVKSILGISRSSQHDAQLKKAGYSELYRSEDYDSIKNQLKNHKKTAFMDCVGGLFAGHIFNLLPSNSIMVNYGRLSKENLGGIDLGQLYYRNKTIRGFWLNNYLHDIGSKKIEQLKEVIINDSEIFKQKIRQTYPIQHFQQATRQSIKNQSEGKILLRICSQPL